MSLGEDVKNMYSFLIQKMDMFNVFLALLATIALICNEQAYLQALLIIGSAVTLIATKYKFNRAIIFLTYACSIFYFGLFFTKITDIVPLQSIMLPSNVGYILILAITIGTIASYANFGSNTLSVVWLTLHLFILISTFQLSNQTSFFAAYWSEISQLYTIQTYYPFLLAGLLIGIYLEKYQVEIKRERRNN